MRKAKGVLETLSPVRGSLLATAPRAGAIAVRAVLAAPATLVMVAFLEAVPARAADPPSDEATPGGPAPAESVTTVAGFQYRRSGLPRSSFGSDYRLLWTTPVRVDVLDLASEAGGLSVVRRVGGKQTKALALKGADGRSYTFRGLEKDVGGLLEEDFRGT